MPSGGGHIIKAHSLPEINPDASRDHHEPLTMSETTVETIFTVARLQVQAHGYDGLNFREIASRIGIKAPSLYHHFPIKAALGAAVARRYCADMQVALDAVSRAEDTPGARLLAYPGIFRKALLRDNRICLASFLSAQIDDLPDDVRAEVLRFIEINLTWLAGHLSAIGPADIAMRRADANYAAVAGAQLTARSSGGVRRYDEIIASYRSVGLFPA